MNRLSQTKPAVFKLLMLYLKRMSFHYYSSSITTAVVQPCGGHKMVMPVNRYSVIFIFAGLWGLNGSTLLFENSVSLKLGLGGVRTSHLPLSFMNRLN